MFPDGRDFIFFRVNHIWNLTRKKKIKEGLLWLSIPSIPEVPLKNTRAQRTLVPRLQLLPTTTLCSRQQSPCTQIDAWQDFCLSKVTQLLVGQDGTGTWVFWLPASVPHPLGGLVQCHKEFWQLFLPVTQRTQCTEKTMIVCQSGAQWKLSAPPAGPLEGRWVKGLFAEVRAGFGGILRR